MRFDVKWQLLVTSRFSSDTSDKCSSFESLVTPSECGALWNIISKIYILFAFFKISIFSSVPDKCPKQICVPKRQICGGLRPEVWYKSTSFRALKRQCSPKQISEGCVAMDEHWFTKHFIQSCNCSVVSHWLSFSNTLKAHGPRSSSREAEDNPFTRSPTGRPFAIHLGSAAIFLSF